MSYGGSVACKSPCHYHHYTLKHLKPLRGEGPRREESGSSGRRREAWTHRDIYIQSDRLPGIVSLRALMSDPLFPVQKGERHAMTMGPKQDKEEMFKFRPPSSTISSFTATELWSCLVFCEFLQFSPPELPLPIVSFQWKDFHIQRKSQRRIGQ